MAAALSEQMWRPRCAGGWRTLRRPRRPSRRARPRPSARPRSRPRAGSAGPLHDEPGRAAPHRSPDASATSRRSSEIVRQYGDKVFSLIYRMLGNRQEAEDVAQDVFITVFKTIESFRGEAKFSTWLLRIAANHSKNRIKHLARRPTEGVDPEDVSQVRTLPDRPAPPVQAQIEGPGQADGSGRDRAAHAAGDRQASPRTSGCWSCFATSRRCRTRRSRRSPGCRKAP